MKITQSRSKAVKYGSKGSKSFGVNTKNSKFFRVMSDTLYTDKIGSIIRELASNAIDGQRAQGNLETPFDIFLPCRQNPKFCIRDYGTGLSPDEIETVYTQYFESTKDENEDDIGGFGLGAKTPFAYTDSFVVRSYYNGQVHTYTIAFSGDEPEYELQFSQETNEPNGLEVYFDVDPEDFSEFAQKAFRTLIWFNHIPNVWGGSEDSNGFFKIAAEFQNYREQIANFRSENCYEDENMILCPTGYKNPFDWRGSRLASRICVIQGGVLYPVSPNASEAISDIVSRIPNDVTVITKHKIGEISLTPSREQIEESKSTIKNIDTKVEVITKTARETLRQHILNDDNSKFTASATIQSLRQRNSYSSGIVSLEEGYLCIAKTEETLAQETFKERFDESLMDYKKRVEDFKGLVPMFEGDKVSAYTKQAGYTKPKKVKDIAEMRFATNSFNKIHLILRDSSISAQIQSVMQESGIGNNELAFVIDTYKKALKDSQHSEKLDYLAEIKDNIIDFLECEESDLSITHESDIVTKANSTANIRVYEKNTYAVFEKPYNQENISDSSVNSIGKYEDNHILYAIKDGHGKASIDITDAKGDKRTLSFPRNELAEVTMWASIMFNMKHDTLLIVNKKELKDITKQSTGSVTELGEALENAMTKNQADFSSKIETMCHFVEQARFVNSFASHRHMTKVFQMIGKAKDVKELDTLLVRHGDALEVATAYNAFDRAKTHANFAATPIGSLTYGYSRNGVLNLVEYAITVMRHNNVVGNLKNGNKTIVACIDKGVNALSIERNKDNMIGVQNFLNDDARAEYPMLKLLTAHMNHGKIDEEVAKDIEFFIKAKISEKKCKKEAA